MASTRKQILNDLIIGLEGINRVDKATEFFPPLDKAEHLAPIVIVVVEAEKVIMPGSNRYRADLGLYVITDQDYTGIEDLIVDIKTYVKSASITNVLTLIYMGHDPVIKEDLDENKYSSTRINFELLYKDTNSDTEANATPTYTREGYMSIAQGKVYDLAAASGSTIQALGTNVYDSHRNDNLTIPAGSGSLSVDIIESNVIPNTPGISFNDRCDYNEIIISMRGHFAEGTTNNTIMPFMYKVVNEIRSNIDLGNNYHVHTNEPFNIIYDQEFEESGTQGSELTFNIKRYWEY